MKPNPGPPKGAAGNVFPFLKPNTGPPSPMNVEPAQWQPGGTNRQFILEQTATGNNLRPHCDRQVGNLAALSAALPQSTWIHLRKACLEKEVCHG
jgi:hypothetical protein